MAVAAAADASPVSVPCARLQPYIRFACAEPSPRHRRPTGHVIVEIDVLHGWSWIDACGGKMERDALVRRNAAPRSLLATLFTRTGSGLCFCVEAPFFLFALHVPVGQRGHLPRGFLRKYSRHWHFAFSMPFLGWQFWWADLDVLRCWAFAHCCLCLTGSFACCTRQLKNTCNRMYRSRRAQLFPGRLLGVGTGGRLCSHGSHRTWRSARKPPVATVYHEVCGPHRMEGAQWQVHRATETQKNRPHT